MNRITNKLLVAAVLFLACACGNKKEQTTETTKVEAFPQLFTKSSNVGNPAIQGSFEYDNENGIYTLKGAGENVWGESDQFFFAYEEMDGDFSLSTKLEFAPAKEGSNIHRKAGIMIRESLEGNSAYADITVHYGDGLTSLQYRSVTGGGSDEVKTEILSGNYMTLERKGNKIIAKVGNDRFSDTIDAEIELALSAKCFVGFFINSHNVAIEETAFFSDVKLIK